MGRTGEVGRGPLLSHVLIYFLVLITHSKHLCQTLTFFFLCSFFLFCLPACFPSISNYWSTATRHFFCKMELDIPRSTPSTFNPSPILQIHKITKWSHFWASGYACVLAWNTLFSHSQSTKVLLIFQGIV